MNMDAQETTFNDIPKIIGNLVNKIDHIESLLLSVKAELHKQDDAEHEHIPMNLKEACEFLKVKRSTMYYYLEKQSIPATRSGKNYIFFKDELILWAESGRNNARVLTPEQLQEEILSMNKRKPRRRRELPD